MGHLHRDYKNLRPEKRVALIYLIISIVWILFSDAAVFLLPDRGFRLALHTLKGWLFVSTSAVVIYYLMRHYVAQMKKAWQEALASEERLNLVLQSVNDGVWDWDLRTGLAYLSPKYYEIVGYSPGQITPDRQFFLSLIHPDDRPQVNEVIDRHLQRETADYRAEFRMIAGDGQDKWVLTRGRVVERDPDGQPLRMLGTISDISERKRIELTLQESENRYRTVVEDQTEVICRFLPDGTFIFANEVYCRLFDKTPEELIGNRWQPSAHPDDIPAIEAQLRAMSPANPIVVIENRAYVASGELRWMQFANRGFYDDQGQLREIQSVGRDITDRKKIEETIRRYIQRLLEQEEEIRKKLASELHDQICQDLTALGLDIAMITRLLPDEARNGLADRIKDTQAFLEEIIRSVRDIMAELRPPVLDYFGLAAALNWHAEIFTKRTGLAVELDLADNLERMAPEKELALLRIAQEAMNNASKYAAATTLRLSLARKDGTIRMSVSDNGIGFDVGQELQRLGNSGWGLTIMQERAQSINGHFAMDSAPGRGTTVRVMLKEEA
ncbi:PAS domain S-box protein [Geobacter pelophilus]|uniref:Oxygen sensor histidine kinase NreB n=1 Tax=Geoanaerobacter pelophilus TaxID=60036 RepID=A0AAW4L3Y2_9BACT|nr:PAS domain S-box protein [Geoanaerobacter pelophilus]MBT0665673.1 PAS domain S-box protein [Geoanaerobacter pelophilus]